MTLCGDAVRLRSKGRHGSFHLWINVWVADKLCDPSLTRVIPERLRDEFPMIKCYANLQLLYFRILEAVAVVAVIVHFTTCRIISNFRRRRRCGKDTLIIVP